MGAIVATVFSTLIEALCEVTLGIVQMVVEGLFTLAGGFVVDAIFELWRRARAYAFTLVCTAVFISSVLCALRAMAHQIPRQALHSIEIPVLMGMLLTPFVWLGGCCFYIWRLNRRQRSLC